MKSDTKSTIAVIASLAALGFTAAIVFDIVGHIQQFTQPLRAAGSTYTNALAIVTGQAGQAGRVA